MQYSEEEVHAFLKNKVRKQKNKGIYDHRYTKCKQSQCSYEQIKGIVMADQKQSQDKNAP